MAKKKNGNAEAHDTLPPSAPPKRDPDIRHKFIQKLPCRVDEPAMVTMAEGMASASEELEIVEEERAEAMRGFKQKITGIKERMKELAKGIRSRTEERDVECIERLNAAQAIEVVRLDTGEILETRAADAVDLQDKLFDDDPAEQAATVENPIEDPEAVLSADAKKWTTGPNPKPIEAGA